MTLGWGQLILGTCLMEPDSRDTYLCALKMPQVPERPSQGHMMLVPVQHRCRQWASPGRLVPLIRERDADTGECGEGPW